jgi:hypothetical protein
LLSQEEASIYTENSKSQFVPAFGQKVDLQKVDMDVMKKWTKWKIQDILGAGIDIHHPAMWEFYDRIGRNRFLDIKSVQTVLHELLGAETAAFCEEFWELCLTCQSNSPNIQNNQKEHFPGLLALINSRISGWNRAGCEPANVFNNFQSCMEADQFAETPSDDPALSDCESTDTGSAWMSDYSGVHVLEEDHPFSLIKPIVVREGVLAYQKAKQRAQAENSPSATSGTPNTALGAKHVISSPPKKRTRHNQDGSDEAGDSEDDDELPAKRRRTSKRAAGNQLSFACPFAKKDPLKYRGCYAYVLKRVRDVKQHLSRFHQLPIYCPRCSDTFEAEDERDGHIRASSCPVQQENITFEGVTRSQKILLGQRVSASMSASDQWFTIFDILFPGHTPRPNSAYINTELTVELEAFQDLMYNEGPRFISSAIRSGGLDISAIKTVEDDLTALLQSAIQEGLQQVFQQWSAKMPGIEQESTNSKHTTTEGSSTSSACPAIQGSELSRSSSKTLVEDIQERNVTAEQNFSLEEYERYQYHALPQGISSSSEVMVADASTLFRSITDLPNSNPISKADIHPVILDENVTGDTFRLGSLEEDSWKEFEIGNLESGASWNFDAEFDEARAM